MGSLPGPIACLSMREGKKIKCIYKGQRRIIVQIQLYRLECGEEGRGEKEYGKESITLKTIQKSHVNTHL